MRTPKVETLDIRPELPSCEALGSFPTTADIYQLHRTVEPDDPFAPQYLRDAASRLRGRPVAVVVWPDGVAAVLAYPLGIEEVVQGYWRAINRFVHSYRETEMPARVTVSATSQTQRKRRYTKRMAANTGTEGSGTQNGKSITANAD